MALGGAWVRSSLGSNYIIFEGRTADADDDTMVLGLDGDGGADVGFTLPANWPTVGAADGVPVTDANLHLRTSVRVIPLTDPAVGVGGAVAFSVEQSSAPFQKTVRMGATPAVAVTMRVEVQYVHSSIR